MDAGDIIDANNNQVEDVRTEQELRDGYWSALQLTDDTGAQDKIANAIASYETIQTQDYQAYWQMRDGQSADVVGGLQSGAQYYLVVLDATHVEFVLSAADAASAAAALAGASSAGSATAAGAGARRGRAWPLTRRVTCRRAASAISWRKASTMRSE